ncbi:hypothetical protein [Siccirubricoccus phaeus]|uniref:hypothetical protein n=1 Tax=Siccirubricoccus phaeus TaxID=2595053 RepID=UPI0011F3189C|nr:hypothetical protein [Siccirubricoccus phaeus]
MNAGEDVTLTDDAPLMACQVPAMFVGEIWPFVESLIAGALRHAGSSYSAADARALVGSGAWLLWTAARPGVMAAAAVSEAPEPGAAALWAVGGETEAGALAAIARQMGDLAEIFGIPTVKINQLDERREAPGGMYGRQDDAGDD